MPTQTVAIKGMHCRSCEFLIVDELSQLSGVKKVTADAKTGVAVLTLKNTTISSQQLSAAVKRAGYELGQTESLKIISTDPQAWQQAGLMALLISLSLVLLNRFGGMTSVDVSGQPTGMLTVLLIGLTAGVSTCMALVGGLSLAIAARHAASQETSQSSRKFEPVFLFQLGRVGGFLLLGGLLGVVGGWLQPTPFLTSLLTLLVAGVMLLLGLQLTGLFPKLSAWSTALPTILAQKLGLQVSKQITYSRWQTLLTGFLTFFVPCGFTQSMQILATSSGNFISGAIIMGIFALGTLPGLTLAGSLGSFVSSKRSKAFGQFVGVLVVVLAVNNAINGANVLAASSGAPVEVGTVSGEVQEIKMVQNAHGYSPRTFTVKKNQPVRWIVDSKDSYSCASSLLVSQFGINSDLKPGENIFEFTPTKVGKFTFTCSMGMYTGTIAVTE